MKAVVHVIAIILAAFCGSLQPSFWQSAAAQPVVTISVSPQQAFWHRIEREWPADSPQVVWEGPPLRDPRGITRLGNSLYVTDPGLPTDSPRRPKIIRFPLVNDQPGAPIVFFERPGFLLSAKFASPAGGYDGNINALVVADQGEELPNGTFTGRGAKILYFPILADGSADEPRVIREGAPYFCPSGIHVVDEVIYVSDPCAGPLMSRPEVPTSRFPSSILFAQDFAGNPPRNLRSGRPFTSLIGIDSVEHADRPPTLLIADTDSGRIDPSGTGGRPGFAPPAAAEVWVFDILDPVNAVLARPRRLPLTEQGPVKLLFVRLPLSASVVVRMLAGNTFADFTTVRRFRADDVGPDGLLSIDLVSPVELASVTLEVEVLDSSTGERIAKQPIRLVKDPNQPTLLVDYKGGWRKKPTSAVARAPSSPSSRTFLYAIDQATGRTWFFPESGGTPVSVARSAKPFAGITSEDQSRMWITDRTGKLLVAQIPDFPTLESLFPYAFVKYCDANGSGVVDRYDISAMMSALGLRVGPFHPFDLDSNGIVDIGDVRSCTLGCNSALCQPEF